MFSLHYISDNTDTADDIEVYSIYSKLFKKFLSFTTIRINRTKKQIYFSNFDELSIDMRKDIYVLVKESKEELDIEGYKAKREKTLEDLAEKIARTVVKTRRDVTLEPMQAYERKIIHSKLQSHQKVTTKSIGEEPRRRVVITLIK